MSMLRLFAFAASATLLLLPSGAGAQRMEPSGISGSTFRADGTLPRADSASYVDGCRRRYIVKHSVRGALMGLIGFILLPGDGSAVVQNGLLIAPTVGALIGAYHGRREGRKICGTEWDPSRLPSSLVFPSIVVQSYQILPDESYREPASVSRHPGTLRNSRKVSASCRSS